MSDTSEHREKWLRAALDDLDRAEAGVDAAMSGRLRAARRQALGRSQRRRTSWTLATAAACTAALVVVIWPQTPVDETPAPQAVAVEDLSIITAPEELEFYQSLDFLLWLDEQGAQLG